MNPGELHARQMDCKFALERLEALPVDADPVLRTQRELEWRRAQLAFTRTAALVLGSGCRRIHS